MRRPIQRMTVYIGRLIYFDSVYTISQCYFVTDLTMSYFISFKRVIPETTLLDPLYLIVAFPIRNLYWVL